MPLTQEDQMKYKTLYLQAAGQYIIEMQSNLLKLRQGKETPEVIDTLHRDAHSLKGQSLMMEYKLMGTLSLQIEKIFEAKKNNKIKLTEDLVDKLTTAASEMEDCLNRIDSTNKEKDLSSIIAILTPYIHIPV